MKTLSINETKLKLKNNNEANRTKLKLKAITLLVMAMMGTNLAHGDWFVGIQQDAKAPADSSVIEKRLTDSGFKKMGSKAFKGKLYTKPFKTDAWLFIGLRRQGTKSIGELIDAKTGVTLSISGITKGNRKKSSANDITDEMFRELNKAGASKPSGEQDSPPVVLSFKGAGALSPATDQTLNALKQALLSNPRIALVNGDFRRDVVEMQDEFIVGGWKRNRSIHGHMLPADYLCYPKAGGSKALSLIFVDVENGNRKGNVIVGGTDSIPAAVKRILELIEK